MKIPNSILVCGTRYQVQLVRKLKSEGKSVWGCVQHGDTLIKIEAGLSPERQRTVLVHEVQHAVETASCLDYAEITRPPDDITDSLAQAWQGVIANNPDLVTYLTCDAKAAPPSPKRQR